MNWLADNRPSDVAACVIHGDWRVNTIMDTHSPNRAISRQSSVSWTGRWPPSAIR